MSQQELLNKVIQILEAADLEYMITGSVASSLQGEPRSTYDIDIVIAIQDRSVPQLLRSFPSPDYYLDEERVFAALFIPTACSI